MPVRTDETEMSETVRQLLYASLTSFISLLLLIIILRCNRYASRAQQAMNHRNVKRIATRITGVRVVERTAPSEVNAVNLMGNTAQSEVRRTRKWTTRSRVRQGFT